MDSILEGTVIDAAELQTVPAAQRSQAAAAEGVAFTRS